MFVGRVFLIFLWVGFHFITAAVAGPRAPQEGAPSGPPPAPVEVARLVEQEVAASKMFVGTVQPRYEATIGAAVAGRVVEVMVEEGDHVRQGQPLVQQLTDTFELERATAEAELELRKQELLELENGARPEELAQAEADLLAAEARMQYESRRRDRLQRLRAEQAVSTEELDEAANAAIVAEQVYREAQATLNLIKAGPRAERIAQAQARMKMQEAVVSRLQDQIDKHTIVSRFDGYVTRKYVERGQWVNQGMETVHVVGLSQVDVVVSVAEEHIPFVNVGTSIPVTVTSAPEKIFAGTVVAIVPRADERARTFPVKVRIENTEADNGPVLKAGMLARVNLPTSVRHTCLLAPKDAIVLGGQTPVVYLLRTTEPQNAPQVFPTPVELGTAHGGLIEVRGDLQAGDQVVVRGNERLRPGQVVRVVASAGSQAADTNTASGASSH